MMCCMFCISFRGAAYFGTTAQILIGLAIVIKYSTSLTEAKWQDFQFGGSGPVAILFAYGVFIFAFGCCIFKAIESESLRTLKVCVGGLTILQCLVLVTHLVLLSLTFDILGEGERISQVSVLAVNLILSFVLLTTYFLYMIRLAKREWALLRRESCSGSGSSVPMSSNNTTLKGEGLIMDMPPMTMPIPIPKVVASPTTATSASASGGRCSVGSSSASSTSAPPPPQIRLPPPQGRAMTLHHHHPQFYPPQHHHHRSSSGNHPNPNVFGFQIGASQRYMDGQWENLHV